MSVTIAPKWKIWIGKNLFFVGIIFAALGFGSLFFGNGGTFATVLLVMGILPLILSIILIRNNWEKNMKDPQF